MTTKIAKAKVMEVTQAMRTNRNRLFRVMKKYFLNAIIEKKSSGNIRP